MYKHLKHVSSSSSQEPDATGTFKAQATKAALADMQLCRVHGVGVCRYLFGMRLDYRYAFNAWGFGRQSSAVAVNKVSSTVCKARRLRPAPSMRHTQQLTSAGGYVACTHGPCT